MRGNSVDPGRLATVDGQRRPSYVVRRARTADVAAHPRLVDAYSASRILLSKATVTLYEDVQEFWVADTPESGGVIGCGALHVMLGRPRRGSHAGHGPSWDRSRRGECRAGTTVSVADEFGSGARVLPHVRGRRLRRERLRGARGHAGRARGVCVVAVFLTMRASPSSWISTGSSRTRWATPVCCGRSDPGPLYRACCFYRFDGVETMIASRV